MVFDCCVMERGKKIHKTTGGILPLYQIAWCWCITLYAPTVLACLRGHRLMSGNGLKSATEFLLSKEDDLACR